MSEARRHCTTRVPCCFLSLRLQVRKSLIYLFWIFIEVSLHETTQRDWITRRKRAVSSLPHRLRGLMWREEPSLLVKKKKKKEPSLALSWALSSSEERSPQAVLQSAEEEECVLWDTAQHVCASVWCLIAFSRSMANGVDLSDWLYPSLWPLRYPFTGRYRLVVALWRTGLGSTSPRGGYPQRRGAAASGWSRPRQRARTTASLQQLYGNVRSIFSAVARRDESLWNNSKETFQV